MKRKLLIALFFLLSACSSHQVSTSEQTLYERVQTAIRTHETKFLSDYEYEEIAIYMSEGKSRWIALYPEFHDRPFISMTSFQEGLNISMAYALSENPEETLKFVDKNNVGEICGVPFIEPTKAEIDSYYLKTRAALMAQGLQGQWREKCLSVLNTTMRKSRLTD